MQYDRIRKLQLVERSDAAKRAAERYEIFVAGPFIDVSKDVSDPVNSGTSGKEIRYAVHRHYSSSGHNVYLGEDTELRLIGEKHYGPLSNAAFFERHYIKDNIHALIIFPDGPGVFCEFGDWATTKSTCEKMLVVIDSQHEGKPSYINDGTAKAAASFGATVSYIDYADRDRVIRECDEFVAKLAAMGRIDELYSR
ncbi:MAG TPA: hypothetical protein VNS02_07335 [Rhizobiaceae bacterium]|nr:hypothetical protein [Rhizobiaceae bacterium]